MAEDVIEIWKAVVEMQKHFNDIAMRIRVLYVTVMLAAFAAIGTFLEKPVLVSAGPLHVNYAVLMALLGAFGTYMFYFIDRHWYHRLLRGAVEQGKRIERRHLDKFPDIGLTMTIGARSSFRKLHSDQKIVLMYGSAILLFVLTAAFLALALDPTPMPEPGPPAGSVES
jgi:hypothetical protein